MPSACGEFYRMFRVLSSLICIVSGWDKIIMGISTKSV